MGSDNQAHVRLQTLLNVSAAHPREEDEVNQASKRVRVSSRPARAAAPEAPRVADAEPQAPPPALEALQGADSDEEATESTDAFHTHFGAESADLQGVDTRAIEWRAPEHVGLLGGATLVRAARPNEPHAVARVGGDMSHTQPHLRVWNTFQQTYARLVPAYRELVDAVGRYLDVWEAHLSLDRHDDVRSVLAMHAMSHVARTRQRILKDNERLAKAAAAAKADGHDDELPELRDQGFTRPKVLLLVPFRNTAKAWVERLIALSACDQVEQKARFFSEFSLPPNAVDKLADPELASRYPEDHRKTFRGNIDDNFKLGVKLTRKTLKMYGAFFESDIIVASPLGLRLLMEKEQ